MLVILLILLVNAEKEDLFPEYGIYCGLGHTSIYGEQPIDELDRYCQIHDICTSYGLMECFCNEQLYYKVSGFNAQTNIQRDIKDSILSYIYVAILNCDNLNGISDYMAIGKASTDEYPKGFTYFPIYGNSRVVSILNHGSVNLYLTDIETYKKFTREVYDNPRAVLPNIFVDKYILLQDDQIIVAVSKMNPDSTPYIRYETMSDSQTYAYSVLLNILKNETILIILSIVIMCILIGVIIILSCYMCHKLKKILITSIKTDTEELIQNE